MIVGSGKTATDGIVWLLANGVPPDRIVWVRPRDPWMLNRAVVQPDPVVALGLAADTMAAAADAESLDDLFLRLEAAGVMLRIDPDVVPDDGQDADARRVGARPAPHHRARRSPGPRQARDAPRDRPRRRVGPAGAGLARRALRGGKNQCVSFVCHVPNECQVENANDGASADSGTAATGNAGKACCVPGTPTRVSSAVCGQRQPEEWSPGTPRRRSIARVAAAGRRDAGPELQLLRVP